VAGAPPSTSLRGVEILGHRVACGRAARGALESEPFGDGVLCTTTVTARRHLDGLGRAAEITRAVLG